MPDEAFTSLGTHKPILVIRFERVPYVTWNPQGTLQAQGHIGRQGSSAFNDQIDMLSGEIRAAGQFRLCQAARIEFDLEEFARRYQIVRRKTRPKVNRRSSGFSLCKHPAGAGKQLRRRYRD